jgi:ATP-binding cassette, subfamily B, bacterial
VESCLFFSFGIFWILVTRWSEGFVSTGEFVLILALVSQITGTLLFIGRAFNNTARTLGEMAEGLDDLIIPYEIRDAEARSVLSVSEGVIVWQDVNFKFDNSQVFDSFNLSIASGERVGLVGPSGAGKSTFVSLLLRQYDLESGQICIDGQNIAEVTQDSLCEAIAVVPQEPMLFHRTIRENIAYGKPDATDEEIIAVAKKAQAHDFISALPLGYDTLVGERGVKLSGGQKQRVAIARAMLKDAPILVLDEATSALDSESEVAIQNALHELMAGKTVVAIAHRLSTLREMDRIIVLEEGKIVEDGNHNSLKDAGGTYQRLWEHQAGGFLIE